VSIRYFYLIISLAESVIRVNIIFTILVSASVFRLLTILAVIFVNRLVSYKGYIIIIVQEFLFSK